MTAGEVLVRPSEEAVSTGGQARRDPGDAVASRAPSRVAYVMSRFPKLSETFVANEIAAVERAGVHVEIHPLIRERAPVVHLTAAVMTVQAHFVPPVSGQVVRALGFFLVRRPGTLASCLAALLADTWRRPGTLLRSLALFPVIVAHARLMWNEGVEHVHCHFATYPAFAGFVIQRLTGIPYSFTAHAHDIQVHRSMLRRKVREAAFVVAISEESRRRIAASCGRQAAAKVRVIHCGVETARFRPNPAAGLDDRAFTILSVGRLIPVKGHVHLIGAAGRLAAAGVTFRCRIVGDGPLRDDLDREIEARGLADRVELLGARTSDEVRALMETADAVVLPSVPLPDGREEGIPVTLMEAMSSGLPVVASRTGGIPELVEDRVSGLLVEPGDPEGLADALALLAANPGLRTRLGDAGRRRVVAAFDLDDLARQLAAEFAAVVDARRRPEQAVSAVAADIR